MTGGVRGPITPTPIQTLQAGISSLSSKLGVMAGKIQDLCFAILGLSNANKSEPQVFSTTVKDIGAPSTPHPALQPKLGETPTHQTSIKNIQQAAQPPQPAKVAATPLKEQTYKEKIQTLVNQINSQGCAKFGDAQLDRSLSILRGTEGIDVDGAIRNLETEKKQRAGNKENVSIDTVNQKHTANLKVLENIGKFMRTKDNFHFHDQVSTEHIRGVIKEAKGFLMQLKEMKNDKHISPQEKDMYESQLRGIIQSGLSTIEDRSEIQKA